jgi:hypothetical protein
LEEEQDEVFVNDIIMYSHLYNFNNGIQNIGIVVDVNHNFWIGRQEFTVFSESKIEKLTESMITYRKI